MRLPRMTTRRWMIAVAIFGALAGLGVALERRREGLEALALEHQSKMMGLGVGSGPPSGLGLLGWAPDRRSLTPSERARDEWHFRMMSKYRTAASRPWLPVEPDPPEPE
jgi:hypothetical protein